jgi:hypothetical protein
MLRITGSRKKLWKKLPDPTDLILTVAFDGADPDELAVARRVLKAQCNALTNTFQEEIKHDNLSYWWNRARRFAAFAMVRRGRGELPRARSAGQRSSG